MIQSESLRNAGALIGGFRFQDSSDSAYVI